MEPHTPRKRRVLIVMSVVALVAVMLLPVAALGAGPFDDVPDDHTFVTEITWLKDTGITKGCNPSQGNTKFCPDNPVTRGQMSAFMSRLNTYLNSSFLAIDGKANTSGHADTASEAEYAANAGKLDGLDSSDFAPASVVTANFLMAGILWDGSVWGDRESGLVSSTKTDTGQYILKFDRTVTSCVTATNDAIWISNRDVSAATDSGAADEVYVRVRNDDDTAYVDTVFEIILMCPTGAGTASAPTTSVNE
jgi:hypothetical protein